MEKVGGGKPSKQAVGQLFALVDADKEWYPGKHNGAKRGRKPLLTPAKRRCIAQSAMAAKREHGEEPCVAAVVHACPRATFNPVVKQPFWAGAPEGAVVPRDDVAWPRQGLLRMLLCVATM